jgi:hypothetical protein
MQTRSEPSTPRPFATLFVFAAAAVQSSPTVALSAGLIAACAGSVVLAITATAVAAIAKRIKEFFLIDEFSVVSALEGEGWSENTGYGGQMKGF